MPALLKREIASQCYIAIEVIGSAFIQLQLVGSRKGGGQIDYTDIGWNKDLIDQVGFLTTVVNKIQHVDRMLTINIQGVVIEIR